jgi:hypothetical protein
MHHFLNDYVFILKSLKDQANGLSKNITNTTMNVKLYPNEVVLNAGDTKQIVDNNTVDGKLIVTNQRIYFKSLAEDAGIFNLEILFENILEVIFYNKGLFLVKGLNIITRDGKSYAFPLKKRDEFGQLINKMY